MAWLKKKMETSLALMTVWTRGLLLAVNGILLNILLCLGEPSRLKKLFDVSHGPFSPPLQ